MARAAFAYRAFKPTETSDPSDTRPGGHIGPGWDQIRKRLRRSAPPGVFRNGGASHAGVNPRLPELEQTNRIAGECLTCVIPICPKFRNLRRPTESSHATS